MHELEMTTLSLLLSPQQFLSVALYFFASHSPSVFAPSYSGPHGSECILEKLYIN